MRTWIWPTLGAAAAALIVGAAALRMARGHYGDARPPGGVEVIGPNTPCVQRLLYKGGIAQDVIAGRSSLLEAAAAFKALDDEGPPAPCWATPPPASDMSAEEFYCREVIEWVRNAAPRERADELTCTLEAELHARLDDGTLRLPDPS